MHTNHALLPSISHWTCIGIYSLVPLITYPIFHHCDSSTLHFSIIVLGRSTCASGFFLIGVTYVGRTILSWGLSEPSLVPLSAPRCDNFFSRLVLRSCLLDHLHLPGLYSLQVIIQSSRFKV
jgi:hypothetical protein